MLARAFSDDIATYVSSASGPITRGYGSGPTPSKYGRSCACSRRRRSAFLGATSVSEIAKDLAQSYIFGERGRRLLKRGHAMVHAKLGR
jgi:hypothetical protein